MGIGILTSSRTVPLNSKMNPRGHKLRYLFPTRIWLSCDPWPKCARRFWLLNLPDLNSVQKNGRGVSGQNTVLRVALRPVRKLADFYAEIGKKLAFRASDHPWLQMVNNRLDGYGPYGLFWGKLVQTKPELTLRSYTTTKKCYGGWGQTSAFKIDK